MSLKKIGSKIVEKAVKHVPKKPSKENIATIRETFASQNALFERIYNRCVTNYAVAAHGLRR